MKAYDGRLEIFFLLSGGLLDKTHIALSDLNTLAAANQLSAFLQRAELDSLGTKAQENVGSPCGRSQDNGCRADRLANSREIASVISKS